MKTLRKLKEGLKVVAVDTLGKTIPKSKINSVQGAIMKRDIQGTRQDESTMGVGEIDAGLYTKKNTYPKTKTKSAAVGENSNPAFHNPFSSTKSSSTVEKIQKAKARKINQPGQGVYKKQTPSTRKRVVNNYMKMLKDIGEQTEYTVKHGDTEHTVNDYDHAINKARSILSYGKAKEVYIHTNGNPTHKWQLGKHIEKIKEEIELDEAGRCWTGYKPKPGKKAYSPGSCVKEEDIADFVIGKDTMDSLRKIRKSETMTKDEKSKAATDFWNKLPPTKSKVAEDNEQLDERGLDVGHQRRQMSMHFDKYIQAVRAGKFNQAREHYKKYNEHKQTLQKTGHTN